MVHVDTCPSVLKLRRHPEKCLPLRWSHEVNEEFLVVVRLEVVNQRGILAIIALAVSDADGNIEDIKVSDRDGQHYLVNFKLLVRDRRHLATIMRNLRQLPAVRKITRVRS